MSKKFHLIKRNGVYYYRRRVPQHLISALGKDFIQHSLKTKNHSKAAKLRAIADVEWDAIFQNAEDAKENGSTLKSTLSRSEALVLVREYLEIWDKKFQKMEAQYSEITAEQLREIRIEHEIFVQILEDPSDPEAELIVGKGGSDLLEERGIDLGLSLSERADFFGFMRRGLLELYRRAAARGRQDFSTSHHDHLFAPEDTKAKLTASTTFGELSSQYFEMYAKDAANKNVSQKTIDQMQSRIHLVREIILDETKVSEIDYDRCLNFRDVLANVPRNRVKLYPGVSLLETIEHAKKDGTSLFSYEMQSRCLGILTKILRLARNKNLVAHVYSGDLKPSVNKISNKEKRKPFSIEQISIFFQCNFYQQCADGVTRPYAAADYAWRFWLPLICLFMGMRPKEVCQLHLTDVKFTKTNVPYFHIIATTNEDDEGKPIKSTKSAASQRKIPIHPELIRIGLLDFVEDSKSKNETMLFTNLKGGKYGDVAKYPLKRFRENYLPQILTLGKKQSFYSFRHSFRDALRHIEAPPEILKAVGGWSQGNLVSDDYGGGNEPEQLLKYVEKIAFAGLDLSHLYVKDKKLN